jgi:hypothetical protein
MSRQLVTARQAERMREDGSDKMVVYLRIAPGDYHYLPLDSERHGRRDSWVWVHDTLVDALDTIRGYGRGLGHDSLRNLFVRTLQGDTVWQGWNPADLKYATEVTRGEFRRRSAHRFRRLTSRESGRDSARDRRRRR